MSFHLIPDVLDAAAIDAIRDSMAEIDFFDGRSTAGRDAATRKANMQAAPSPARNAILKMAQNAISAHPVFMSAARPRHMTPLLLSRYEPGQSYGYHVDNALMGGIRTDLSFTLFLSDPDTYEGGALEIDETDGARSIRLEAGAMIVYPSTLLHSVTPVTKGQRLAIVGWVESWVRDAEDRSILFDLDRVHASLPDGSLRDTLAKASSNLLRRLAGR